MSEVSLDCGCWDINLTSNCCRRLQGFIHYRWNDFYLFLVRNRLSSSYSSFSYTSCCLKIFKLFPEIFSVDRIIRKSCSEHPICLMRTTVVLIMVTSVLSLKIRCELFENLNRMKWVEFSVSLVTSVKITLVLE